MVVQSSSTGIVLTDPGHAHNLSTVTPAIGVLLIGVSDSLHNVNPDDRVMGTIDQTAPSAVPGSQCAHIRNMNVVFPAAWAGGTITVNGLDTFGSAISETHAKPPGGGTSLGVKPYQIATDYVNSAPSGGGPGVVANVTNGILLGVSHYPVAGFTKASFDGVQKAFSTTSLPWGMFDIVGGHVGNHNIEIWYTISLAPSQAPHTHADAPSLTGVGVIDGGHAHLLG